MTPADLPATLFDQPHFFLLDSSLSGTEGQWTIAGWSPSLIVTSDSTPNLLETLREKLREHRVEAPELPFTGGWIGFLGYEFHQNLDHRIPVQVSDLVPTGLFCFYDQFYLYDHARNTSFICGKLPPQSPSYVKRGIPSPISLKSNFTKDEYLAAVRKIKEYITAGDCYQVNLSQRFSAEVSEKPYELYQKLRTISPAPYSAYLNLGNAQILSTSPELFFQVEGKQVTTGPIKGTRPRGATPQEDARLKEELLTSPKDRAELLMITDLMRNDLGKVCKQGSVKVPRLAEVKSFAQVHHLVSTVTGELREECDAIDLLRATFPGGSITGAPKIRAMEIIQELETVPRHVYTGAIGYLRTNGKSQFNIAIRTLLYKEGKVYFSSGGGVVADSDPESEYEETLHKASGILQSLRS